MKSESVKEKKYVCYSYFTNPNRFGAITKIVDSLDEAVSWCKTDFVKKGKVKLIRKLNGCDVWVGYSSFYDDEVVFGFNEDK